MFFITASKNYAACWGRERVTLRPPQILGWPTRFPAGAFTTVEKCHVSYNVDSSYAIKFRPSSGKQKRVNSGVWRRMRLDTGRNVWQRRIDGLSDEVNTGELRLLRRGLWAGRTGPRPASSRGVNERKCMHLKERSRPEFYSTAPPPPSFENRSAP